MGFAAINAAAHQGEQSRARETLEAQESRLANTYAAGLQFIEEGRRSEALVSLIPGSLSAACPAASFLLNSGIAYIPPHVASWDSATYEAAVDNSPDQTYPHMSNGMRCAG